MVQVRSFSFLKQNQRLAQSFCKFSGKQHMKFIMLLIHRVFLTLLPMSMAFERVCLFLNDQFLCLLLILFPVLLSLLSAFILAVTFQKVILSEPSILFLLWLLCFYCFLQWAAAQGIPFASSVNLGFYLWLTEISFSCMYIRSPPAIDVVLLESFIVAASSKDWGALTDL